MYVVKFKYSHVYDEVQTLKQRLATNVLYNGEMEQRLINASKDELGYMDPLHLKAVMSQGTVMESLPGNFVLHVQSLQTLSTNEVVAVSDFINDAGHETLIDLCKSISECETAGCKRYVW